MSFKPPKVPGLKVTAGGKPPCSKPGCRTSAKTKGLCALHWQDFLVDERRREAQEQRHKDAWERSRTS
jgi:hypothetical protein